MEEKAKSDREIFDLTSIPFIAMWRLGRIFEEGRRKYGHGNWRKGAGDRGYQIERANHALKHMAIYVHSLMYPGESLGIVGEDDLAKVMWFCATQMELERIEALEEKERSH